MKFPKDVRLISTMALDLARQQPCIVCGQRADPHHLKTRASGGHDVDYNLMPLCREHHAEIHKLGNIRTAEKYEQVKNWLIKHDWSIYPVTNKWEHS